jgi:small subunit ribosomal protein S16
MQRVGRKGLAQFRVVVQDSRRTPSSGKVVANLGHYNPHSKEIVINKEKAQFYLDHGAQPSDRVVLLLQKEGVKLPKWVSVPAQQKRQTRNPDKLRKNQPTEEKPTEEPVEAETPAEEPEEQPTEDKTEA